jgi:RecG-like helicase
VPQPARCADHRASRRGSQIGAAAAELGIETVGDALLHVPHSHRDRAEPRQLSNLRIGEQATVEVDGALGAPQADPPPRPDDRRGDRGG